MKVIRQYELTRFDEGGCETMAKTAESVLDVMRGWLGFSEANGKFKEIIDTRCDHNGNGDGCK